MNLYERLAAYRDGGTYPMHMPGHKRNTARFNMENPYGLDITEIEGFDDLHQPEGILREGQERAARAYGAEESWYLVGGSTAGILAGITACTKPGDRVLAARSCHRSVYHAMLLNQLTPEWLLPQPEEEIAAPGVITPEDVEQALTEDGEPVSLCIITSPTYEGRISDVRRIAQICHAHGVPLLVDEAHGAHLGFGGFPEGALAAGADLVVQSLHKTLPAFTQTGLLHAQGSLVNRERVKRCLDIFQTSSPSYLLMAGIDRCVRFLEQPAVLAEWHAVLEECRSGLRSLRCLQLVENGDRDPSKLVLATGGSGHTGPELMRELRRRGFELEMAAADYALAMTGAGDEPEKLRAFVRAVTEIDAEWVERLPAEGIPADRNRREALWKAFSLQPRVRLPLWLAEREEGVRLPLWGKEPEGSMRMLPPEERTGRICVSFLYAYPPGIPLLAPGEEITETVWEAIAACRAAGIALQGEGREKDCCRVL